MKTGLGLVGAGPDHPSLSGPVIDINLDREVWSCLQDLTGQTIRNPGPHHNLVQQTLLDNHYLSTEGPLPKCLVLKYHYLNQMVQLGLSYNRQCKNVCLIFNRP